MKVHASYEGAPSRRMTILHHPSLHWKVWIPFWGLGCGQTLQLSVGKIAVQLLLLQWPPPQVDCAFIIL